MKGHKYGVYCLVLSFSNKHLFSGSADNSIGVWTCKSRKRERSLDGHTATVVGLIKSKNEQFLFSMGKDNVVMVWAMRKYTLVNKIESFSASNSSRCLALSDQFYTLFGRDKKERNRLRAVNLMSGETVKLLKLHQKSLRCLILDPENEFLFTGGWDGIINVLRVEDTQVINAISSHTAPINCLAVSNDGQFLASASDDKTTRLFKRDLNFQSVFTFTHKVEVSALLFSRSNKRLITGGWHFKPIKIWHVGSLGVVTQDSTVDTPGQYFMSASPLNWKKEEGMTTNEKVKERVLNFAKGLDDMKDLAMTRQALEHLEVINTMEKGVDANFKEDKHSNRILRNEGMGIQELPGEYLGEGNINDDLNFLDNMTINTQSRDFDFLNEMEKRSLGITEKNINEWDGPDLGLATGVSTIKSGAIFQKRIERKNTQKGTRKRKKTKIRIK